MKPSRLRRLAIVVGCLIGGALWPIAVGNLLLVGIAGCEEPICGESPLLYTGLFVAAMAAMTLAMAGIATEPPANDGRRFGLVAAAFMTAAMVLVVIGFGFGLLVALAANVIFAASIGWAKVHSSGAAITLALAAVGHVIGFGVLLFPFAWLWLAISVALGPRAKMAIVEAHPSDEAVSWGSYGLGVWRVQRTTGLPGINPGDVLGLETTGDELVFFKPRVGRIAGFPVPGVRVTQADGDAISVASSGLAVLLHPMQTDPAGLLALASRRVH